MQFQDDQSLVKFVVTAKLEEWVEKLYKKNSEAVQVHSQGQIFYKLDRLFPNEQPNSKAHRILSFESITEASFGRAANNVNRIFKNSSYTVEASDNTIAELDEETFDGQNFYAWFLDEWTKWALKEDPNSRFVVYPPEYVKEGNPPLAFVASNFIKWFDKETFVFISEAESAMKYELKETKVRTEIYFDQSINQRNARTVEENTFMPIIEGTATKPVYHIFQKGKGFYRMTAGDSDQGGQSYILDFYPIKQDFLPLSDVGGDEGKHGVNKSFLHPFVNFGNLALLQHSQHTAVNFTFSFPRMAEMETPCEAVGCVNGKVECEEHLSPDGSGFKSCNVCKGTGYSSPQSPYRVYKKKFDPQGMEGDDKSLAYPMVEYYTPDVAILDYSKKEWKEYLEMAETAVYIQQRVKTGNVEAAKSKEIDREDLYAFLSQVGKTFFGKLRFAVQCFENYLNARPVQVSVQTPYSYAILSEGEAFTELQNILGSNVPVMIKANRVESFIGKFVSQSSPIRKFLEVLKLVDPLLYYSKDELNAWKLAGVVSAEQMAIHVFAYPILQALFDSDRELLLQDPKVVAERLKKDLEAFKPEPVEPMQAKFRQPGT